MQTFKPAVRKSVKLKIALTGPSGSGKTYSALMLAKGIGKKIAFLDTENESASLYAGCEGIPEFDTLPMNPPYLVNKYTMAIREAEKQGYDVMVIDSITHAWAGEGGLLQKKEGLDNSKSKNTYANWATITKEHEIFKSTMLNCKIHLICTIRSKQDYSQEEINGKKTIVKLGLAPIQRDGIEYEFTTVFDISMAHDAAVSKDRTGLFDGRIEKITDRTGEEFMEWLGKVTPEAVAVEPNFTDDNIVPFDKFDNPNDNMEIEVGQLTGKTFREALKIDSSRNFPLARWAHGEMKKKSTALHPCYEKYVNYALSESVNLET